MSDELHGWGPALDEIRPTQGRGAGHGRPSPHRPAAPARFGHSQPSAAVLSVLTALCSCTKCTHSPLQLY